MNVDILHKHQDRMKGWAASIGTMTFVEYLQAERDTVVNKLSDAVEMPEVFRLQGELRRIDKFISAVEMLKSRKPAEVKNNG